MFTHHETTEHPTLCLAQSSLQSNAHPRHKTPTARRKGSGLGNDQLACRALQREMQSAKDQRLTHIHASVTPTSSNLQSTLNTQRSQHQENSHQVLSRPFVNGAPRESLCEDVYPHTGTAHIFADTSIPEPTNSCNIKPDHVRIILPLVRQTSGPFFGPGTSFFVVLAEDMHRLVVRPPALIDALPHHSLSCFCASTVTPAELCLALYAGKHKWGFHNRGCGVGYSNDELGR